MTTFPKVPYFKLDFDSKFEGISTRMKLVLIGGLKFRTKAGHLNLQSECQTLSTRVRLQYPAVMAQPPAAGLISWQLHVATAARVCSTTAASCQATRRRQLVTWSSCCDPRNRYGRIVQLMSGSEVWRRFCSSDLDCDNWPERWQYPFPRKLVMYKNIDILCWENENTSIRVLCFCLPAHFHWADRPVISIPGEQNASRRLLCGSLNIDLFLLHRRSSWIWSGNSLNNSHGGLVVWRLEWVTE